MCVAAGWRGCVSQQGTWGSSCAGHAATGPMVMAATADASAVRSVGLHCLSPVVSRARCLQAAVQATAPQFVQSGSAPSAPLLPLCCILVAVSSGGPCCSASGPCPGGRAGGAGCGKLCAPRRSGCVWYGFCRRCSGAARVLEEELVEVRVALCGGWIAECQPLFHHASRVRGLNTALQTQAAQAVGRARRRDVGLRVDHLQRLQRQIKHPVGELFRKGRCPVQGVADPGCRGRELFEHRPLAGTVHPGSTSIPWCGSAWPSTLPS